MTTIEKAVSFIRQIAADDSHGYDQAHRDGDPDYDCSSLVIAAWKNAGVHLTCTYTGNMYADMASKGFEDVTGEVNLANGSGLQSGDVLLNHKNHTAMYIGSFMIAQAGSNENGGITGGQPGDQTGREIRTMPYYNYPWDCVLRYTRGSEASKPTQTDADAIDGTYTVKQGDTLWGIAEKYLGEGMRYTEIKKRNNLTSDNLFVGQKLIIWEDKPTEEETKVIVATVKKSTDDNLHKIAQTEKKTIGQVIDSFFGGLPTK